MVESDPHAGCDHGEDGELTCLMAGTTTDAERRERMRGALVQAVRHVEGDYGYEITGVFGSASGPPWCYTSGLSYRVGGRHASVPAHPELLIVGPQPQNGGGVLQFFGRAIMAGAVALRDGDYLEGCLGNPALPLAIRPVPLSADDDFALDLCGQGLRIREAATGLDATRPYPLLQVVLPDRMGRLPWEPRCDPQWKESQDVLRAGEGGRRVAATPTWQARRLIRHVSGVAPQDPSGWSVEEAPRTASGQ